mgnify:CR=1 FL=1
MEIEKAHPNLPGGKALLTHSPCFFKFLIK